MLAGFLGNLIALRFLGKLPWYERALMLIGGFPTTYYTTPLLTHYLDLEKYRDPVSFFCGVFGMAVIGAALNTLSVYNANPLDWITALLNRRKP